jgi:hypothetical protein
MALPLYSRGLSFYNLHRSQASGGHAGSYNGPLDVTTVSPPRLRG